MSDPISNILRELYRHGGAPSLHIQLLLYPKKKKEKEKLIQKFFALQCLSLSM